MKEKLLKNKTIVIVVAAIVLAAIGFTAGMMVKTSLAKDGGSYIGAEKAKSIALENVGVSSSKATFTKVEIDKDDSPATYDIEFYTASNEYDFEIDAKSGEVVEKSSEAITASHSSNHAAQSGTDQTSSQAQQSTQTGNSASTASGSSSDYIGVAKAKSIALNHAGKSASSVSFTKAKLDSDDGIKTYEIEFVSGNREYEYEINAYTGKVHDHSWDRIENHHDDDHDDHDDDHDYDD